eukprot:CAMPEP_0183369718 /NCGR_PEP_ID=MMETSP0164_2-20130417/100290_1 /TAXON_ID=221442 /ORGANISM="Coccolithus pelagicus ssp braarudi, Strain PLY182g" /LENGTH=55 /DNA_ID=CAMNT_0025546011 /DNA_START=237 /DNA_END=400 /DNA_ORIENTATION=-
MTTATTSMVGDGATSSAPRQLHSPRRCTSPAAFLLVASTPQQLSTRTATLAAGPR